MGINQSNEQIDNASESKLKHASAEQSERGNESATASLDAGHIWMSLAAGSANNGADTAAAKHPGKIPSLPDLDLHSSKDDDHGGKNSVAEHLIDDIHTLLQNSPAGGAVKIRTEQDVNVSKDQNSNDMPVIKCNDIAPGQMGILMSKNADGHTYYTPFIAGRPDSDAKGGANQPININESAAKELHIDLAHAAKAKVDLIALPGDNFSPDVPKTKTDLNDVVQGKLHEMAEGARDKDAEERAKADANLPEPPPPDAKFGYRRTDRSEAELSKVADNYRALAREYQKDADPKGIDERIKAFAKQVQDDISKYKKEVDQHKLEADNAQKLENDLQKQAEKISSKDSPEAKQLQDKLKAAEENAKKSDASLQTSQYNLSYAQSELAISKDKGAYTRHMQARASAAAILSLNPDMDTALSGHRIVVNSGHYPGDKQFPGFFKDDTAEWKLNLESEDVLGSMIKMTGGAVKLVNQIDLKDKSIGGLAAALKAAKPEAAIAIHHDDDDPPDAPEMRGTLTLQCAKTTGAFSLDFAKAVHMAKLNYTGLDDRVNSKGDSVGIREQCGRGIQGHNINAPFILDEQLSTHKDEWPLARMPKVNAEIQFAHVASLYEFFNNKPRYKTSPAEAKLWKDEVWSKSDMDDIWTNRPKVGAW